MKILIPVFNLESSDSMIDQALAIAKEFHFAIMLVAIVDSKILVEYARNERLWHQVDGSIIYNSGMMNEHKEIYNRLTMSAARRLEEIEKEHDLSGIGIEKRILIGEPFEKILETAEREEINLIVMEKVKEKKLFGWIRKTVMDQIVEKSKCPVLLLDAIAG